MAEDVQFISGTEAAIAMRLSNFVTNRAELLQTHIEALDTYVAPVIQSMQGPWVDIFGYASQSGPVDYNLELSRSRAEAVKGRVQTYLDFVNFQIQTAFGESQSLGEPDDNDGYWRAVEIYVYASRPHSEPSPVTTQGSTKFEIRVVGGGSAALGPVAADNYFFQIVDMVNSRTQFFYYTGAGGGLSLPKIPGPGSVTMAGPPVAFETTLPVRLYQFNSTASLAQDGGVTIGGLSFGGTLRLEIQEIFDATSQHAFTIPATIAIEGGSGIQMPGLGSYTSGVLSVVSDEFPFSGY